MTRGTMLLVIPGGDSEAQLLTVTEVRKRHCMKRSGFNVCGVLQRMMVLAHTGLLGVQGKSSE